MTTSTDVLNAVSKLPGRIKYSHSDPTTSERLGLLWAKNISHSVDVVFQAVLSGESEAVAAKKIDKALRHATHWMKDRLLPPFISEGAVMAIQDPTWRSNLCYGEQPEIFEHVIPIEAALNGRNMLVSAKHALQSPGLHEAPQSLNLLSRVLLTPTCRVVSFEDRRLATYSHPDWTRPFARYQQANLEFLHHTPIRVFSTRNGREIPLDAFTWFDFRDELMASPAYSAALSWVESLPLYLQEKFDIETEDLTAKPLMLGENIKSKPYYTREQRNELERYARASPAVRNTLTISGRPAIEIPVNRDRLSIDLLSPDPRHSKPIALRLNIGPERSKFELYYNKSTMSSSGRSLLEGLAARLSASHLHPRISDQKNMLFYHYGRRDMSAEAMLRTFLDAVAAIHPHWQRQEAVQS